MTTHPACCQTHSCDYCPTCLSGTCCQTVTGGRARATQHQTDLDRLWEGIVADQAGQPSLSELLQAETSASLIHRLLGAPVSEPAVPLVHQASHRPERVTAALRRAELPALPPANSFPTNTKQEKGNNHDHTRTCP